MRIPIDISLAALVAHAVIRGPGGAPEEHPHAGFKNYVFDKTVDALRDADREVTDESVRKGIRSTLDNLTATAQEYAMSNPGQKYQVQYPFTASP